jgi:hypothetical protein
MGDQGMETLASLARAGYFQQMEYFVIHTNVAVANNGICAFAARGARAVAFGASGLCSVTSMSVVGRAHALIKNFPHLTCFGLDGSMNGVGSHEAVAGIVRVAGCKHRMEFDVEREECWV